MIIRVALILAINITLLLPLWCIAGKTPEEINDQDTINTTGYILERAPDNSFIQVGDRNYRVGRVEILAEEGHPQQAGRDDIQEDDIVDVIPGAKGVDSFWYAEKITIYRGVLRDKIAQEIRLNSGGKTVDGTQASRDKTNDGVSTSGKPPQQEKMIFENGVWHN